MDNNNQTDEDIKGEEEECEEKQKLLSGLVNPGFDESSRLTVTGGDKDVLSEPIVKYEAITAAAEDVEVRTIENVSTHPSGGQVSTVVPKKKQSFHEYDPSFAVRTNKLCFRYTKSTPLVLNNVSINIKQGSIYGLLGPSGCGKTSLLKCLLDQLSPMSGDIEIFGSKPGSSQSLVPGPGVGYMPQETALYKAFTIRETINYFGCLNGMEKEDRGSRVDFLMKFLDLPQDDGRLIRDLSGGQMRRVSLASALIHSPPLLVLDEPTVGVDPLLRESIWTHLIELSRQGGSNFGHVNNGVVAPGANEVVPIDVSKMTIIITTHYIEEARRADTVCLFRSGIVLCEENPEILLNRMKLDSLELAFLKICQENVVQNTDDLESIKIEDTESPSTSQNGQSGKSSNDTSDTNVSGQVSSGDKNVLLQEEDAKELKDEAGNQGDKVNGIIPAFPVAKKKTLKHDFDLISTLTRKGVINLRRNLAVLFFNIVNPAFQIILFSIAIGTEPKGLNVAVYNPEIEANVTKLDNYGRDNDFLRPFIPRHLDISQDTFSNYSFMFLSTIDEVYVNLINYDSYDDAINSVKVSDTWAAITFPVNYSQNMDIRLHGFLDPDSLTDDVMNKSSVYFHGDFTEFPIQTTLMKSIMNSMQKYFILAFESVGFSNAEKLMKPLVVMTTIYGDPNVSPDYRDFMTPGFILGITFILAVGLTAISFVIERKEGLLERSYVAGVKSYHILAAHVVIQLVIILLQAFFLLVFVFVVFGISNRGSIFLVYALCVMQGICGMSLGFMISAICHEEQPAMMLAMASFYPNMMLSGMVWPLEGMPYFLRQIAYFLPQTMPIKASRSIIGRGLGLTSPQVYLGFVSATAWIIFFNVIALVVFAYKK